MEEKSPSCSPITEDGLGEDEDTTDTYVDIMTGDERHDISVKDVSEELVLEEKTMRLKVVGFANAGVPP